MLRSLPASHLVASATSSCLHLGFRACHLSVGVNKRRAIGYITISSWLHLAAESTASFHCGGVFSFSTLIIISLIATLDTRS